MKPKKSPTPADGGLTRRELHRRGLTLLAGLGSLAWTRAAWADTAEPWASDVTANAALLAGVKYAAETPKPEQRCANCVLYQARGDDRGKCALFQQGLVPAGAWCMSWGPKPA